MAVLHCIQAKYHHLSNERAKHFIKFYENPEQCDIQNSLDKEHLKQAQQNRNFLKRILDIVFLLARQNISFRGHYEGGVTNSTDTQIENH